MMIDTETFKKIAAVLSRSEIAAEDAAEILFLLRGEGGQDFRDEARDPALKGAREEAAAAPRAAFDAEHGLGKRPRNLGA